MAKRSVFFKIGIGFLAAYALYTAGFFLFFLVESYDTLDRKRLDTIANYAAFGEILLESGRVADLAERFDVGLELHDLDYYRLTKAGEPYLYANAAGADDLVEFAENAASGPYTTPHFRHFVVRVGAYELSVGTKRSALVYAKIIFEQNRDFILKDIAFVSVLVFVLVLFYFRDFRQVLEKIKTHGVKRGDVALARSAETLTLLQGLRGYENRVSHLERQNSALKSQVLSALQRELWSGQTPPYEFGCTMARTDINNFTKIFSSGDRAVFMEQINEFFIGVTHIVSRYGGYIYEFVGDEVIFYFKDDEHENSAAIAISALRDINRLAEDMNARTEGENGYSFRVKSSLAAGLLRFGPLVDGLSLAGAPLIETVRLLTHIHEKSENVVLFDGVIAERVSFICTTREQGVVMLKGLANARRLHAYQAHVPLRHHLGQRTVEDFKLATYYRSDGDIADILDFVRENSVSLPREDLLKLLAVLRTYRVTHYSVEIRKSFVEMIEFLTENPENGMSEHAPFLLSAVLASAPMLFPAEAFTGRLRDKFLACLASSDRRIVANTIDVFAELDPGASEAIFEDLMAHADNRIVANTLVKEGKRAWNKTTARRLRRLLNEQSPYYKASGLYALGEIAQHLRQLDEVAFRADPMIQGLLTEVPRLGKHANRMVQRQAETAARKAGLHAQSTAWSHANESAASSNGERRKTA